MIETILKALEAGLVLWNTKEGKKYHEKVIKLKKEYYDEMAKHKSKRSDAVLDDITLELRFIADAFSGNVLGQSTANGGKDS